MRRKLKRLGTIVPFPLPETQTGYYDDAADKRRSLKQLRQITTRAHRAACQIPKRNRWGSKVYISDVMDRLDLPRNQEAWFKRKLLHANTEGLVDLTRFDLVGAGDSAKIRRSEIALRPAGDRYNLAEFHLLTLRCKP